MCECVCACACACVCVCVCVCLHVHKPCCQVCHIHYCFVRIAAVGGDGLNAGASFDSVSVAVKITLSKCGGRNYTSQVWQ